MSSRVSIKTLNDFGFLFCLIGGIITVVMGLLSFIIGLTGTRISWFLGSGFIGIASVVAGAIVSIVFGALAVVIGLKLFVGKIYEFITRFDLIFTALAMVVIAIIVFGIGGILIIVGGILLLVYRLGPEGSENPDGK